MKKVLFAALTVSCFVLVGACSDSSGSSQAALTANEVADRYDYDPGSAEETPTYELNPGYESKDATAARHALLADCLEGEVPYHPPEVHETEELLTRDNQVTFDVDIAEEWGYPELRPTGGEDSNLYGDEDLTDSQNAMVSECTDEVSEELTSPSTEPLDLVSDAGWQATETNTQVEESKKNWKTCLESEDLQDQPDDPWDMPPTSVLDIPEDAKPNQPLELTEEERTIAIADAECRAEAEFEETLFKTRVDAELEAIGKDIETFEAARAEFEDYQERIDTVLAEHG